MGLASLNPSYRLQGIVASEFVRASITARRSRRATEKFEFPVKWRIDLQSEHERYLTEEHAEKPVIVMKDPKDIKAFYMRATAERSRRWTCWRRGSARSSAKVWFKRRVRAYRDEQAGRPEFSTPRRSCGSSQP